MNNHIHVLQERLFIKSSLKMSEFWQRKISTFFHRLDSDKKGFISKNDFELAAQSLCDAEKTDPVKREELKKCYFDVS